MFRVSNKIILLSMRHSKFLGKSLQLTVWTLRSEDEDGSENVAEKVNSRSFNLHRDYAKSLALSNVGNYS